MKGHLIIVSGPSGAGKGTVLSKALAGIDNLSYSVSCTTRKPREGDVNGREYWFMDDGAFREMIKEGRFLEYAEVHGHMYGTRKDIVERALDKGDVILEIDVQGALQVKRLMPDAVTVFIMPPDEAELERRLRSRGTEDEEQIELRLADAVKEMKFAPRYDWVIVNDDADAAAIEFKDVVAKYREGSK